MAKDQAIGEGEVTRYRPRKKAILGMGLLFFIIMGAIAMALCAFRAQNATQTVLSQRKDVQQTWMDKSLDAIRAWRNELLDQARYISSSEMFRLFVIDARNLTPREIEKLADPDSLSSPDEATRTMAEQLTYIQDLLKDFTKRRAWNDARIMLPSGAPMVEIPFSAPLTAAQMELARSAAEKGEALFGPIRQGENGLYMDMADPMFDVLGKDEQKVEAVLFLSVPMDRALTTFLARNTAHGELLLPRIVFMDGKEPGMILSMGGRIGIEPARGISGRLEALPFGLHEALDGGGKVYSMGGMPTGLEWLYVLETPAAVVEEIIHSQKMQIYGLGILASVGIALLCAWLWAGHTSRRHEAEAIRYEKLYRTINIQKMMLDSINSSFKEGMILVDGYGRVQMSNPAFRSISGRNEEIPPATPLVESMPSKAAVSLLEDMSRVNDLGKFASVELTIPTRGVNADGSLADRLYRITLYPYADKVEDDAKLSGCVAIFKDITDFRRKALEEKRKAENERQKQDALISAFVRAVESVEPNLAGQSEKMAGVADLLARELQLDERETETLDLSAKLSQVGKIYVPRELLSKEGKLTPEELHEIRRAPEYADKILRELHFDLPVRETVALIGERVDGSGKPLGLEGSQISLVGRALAVVNAFIAMTSARAWRKDGGMSIQEAISQLGRDGGFDHDVVNALGRIPAADIAKIIGKKTGA